MDQLLSRREQLAPAQDAARAGDALLVGRYVNEAMRFAPIGPGVLRTTTRDFVVGRDRWYATTVPKGTTVMIATQSAMFDDALFDDPDDFASTVTSTTSCCTDQVSTITSASTSPRL
ncbi:cytochrome P450 [Enhygromyxa salina]|uniref:Cytochrome P450 n=1 Tax=Enhygromyxa salina TaxID=215803 RepID=A0A2S9Y3G5_9BACT|nr:cytochrome P450 [Enhygromyxa salina]PRP99643.1 Cytochrome P450 [Enhygromyxa salina]